MQLVCALVLVSLVCAGQLSVFKHGHKNHYNEIQRLIQPSLDKVDSVMLTEIETHVGLENPMVTIYDTCQLMKAEAKTEKAKLVKDGNADQQFCHSTTSEYAAVIEDSQRSEIEYTTKMTDYKNIAEGLWKDQKTAPQKLFNDKLTGLFNGWEKHNRNVTHFLESFKTQKKVHLEYLQIRRSFEEALAQVIVIYRVLNGEGSLSDFSGQERDYKGTQHIKTGGFVEGLGSSTSIYLAKLSKHHEKVPVVSNMLQVFSKTVHKIDSRMNKTSEDFSAVNVILMSIKKNLINTMGRMRDAELGRMRVEFDDNKDRWNAIGEEIDQFWGGADDLVQNFVNSMMCVPTVLLTDVISCPKETGAAYHWQQYALQRKKLQQTEETRIRHQILKTFLENRCAASVKERASTLTILSEEENALSRVLEYLKKYKSAQFTEAKAKRTMDTIMSTPYKWAPETEPVYVPVENTFSSVDNDNDKVSCETMYSTVFTKVRILTLAHTAGSATQHFLDPNDLTHSTNLDVNRRSALANGVQCQLFPNGIPVGRAHSCSKTTFSTAQIDLTGTPYMFRREAEKFFRVLGRKTNAGETGDDTKPATLSPNKRVITLRVRGRCGDVYGDDIPNGDYRSDPIPLELAPTNLPIAKPTKTSSTKITPKKKD